jgi:hypothetical protein
VLDHDRDRGRVRIEDDGETVTGIDPVDMGDGYVRYMPAPIFSFLDTVEKVVYLRTLSMSCCFDTTK